LALAIGATPLSLEEAVQVALQRNETPAILQEQVRAAEAARRRVLARVLPSSDLSGTYSRRLRTATPNGAAVRVANALDAQLTFRTRLVDAPAIPLLQGASDDVEAIRSTTEAQRRDFAFDVAQSFLLVLTTEQLREAAEERIELAEGVVGESQERFQAGLATRNDVSRSELELTAARLDHSQLDNDVRQARLGLGFLLGRPVNEPLAPDPRIQGAVAGSVVPPMVQTALQHRPEVQAARAEIRAARRRAAEPWLRLAPSVDLLGEMRLTNETGFQGRALDGSLQLRAVWAMYDGGLRYADADERDAELQQARLRADQLDRSVELEVRAAQSDLEQAHDAVRLAEDRVRVAALNAEETRERFRSGLATALQQADANVQLFEARSAAAQARFGLRAAQLELLRSVGTPPPGFRSRG
jgi:outer membrane protein TolC